VVAIGGEADEAEFAEATAPAPAGRSARSAPGRPAARGDRRRRRARRRDAAERPAEARAPRRRPSGTKWRLVGIFAQGLAVWLSLLVNGHELRRPSWRPEAWSEIRTEVGAPPQQPPTPIPKNPSL